MVKLFHVPLSDGSKFIFIDKSAILVSNPLFVKKTRTTSASRNTSKLFHCFLSYVVNLPRNNRNPVELQSS